MSVQLPTATSAKDQARHLRQEMAAHGTEIRHAQSLELIAHQHGFRDWNAMITAIGNERPDGWRPGDRVKGTYLSQPFTASVIDVAMTRPEWFRLGLDLDQAIDVVTFASFTNLRKRIRGVVGPKGHSAERTSDGQPHLQIDMTL